MREHLDRSVSELFQHEIDHLDGVLAVDRACDGDALISREVFEAEPRLLCRPGRLHHSTNDDPTPNLSDKDSTSTYGSGMLVVLYADVAGSMQIYEQYGDTLARDAMATCIEVLTQVAARLEGRLVKTIGDEVMCAFKDPVKAVLASNEMQLGRTTRRRRKPFCGRRAAYKNWVPLRPGIGGGKRYLRRRPI